VGAATLRSAKDHWEKEKAIKKTGLWSKKAEGGSGKKLGRETSAVEKPKTCTFGDTLAGFNDRNRVQSSTSW